MLLTGNPRAVTFTRRPQITQTTGNEIYFFVNELNTAVYHEILPGGLMVSALVSGSSGLGLIPGRGHGVVFLGKTLNSHSVSLHPGV